MSQKRNRRTLNALREGKNLLIGRDILLLAADKYLGFAPWKLALSCLVAGLGTLSVFYTGLALFGSPLLKLRGLYAYFSATIGDGLLLPIGVAVSAAALLDMTKLLELSLVSREVGLKDRASALKLKLGGRSLRWIPAGLAFVATASVHAAWLLNPRTEGNWTIVSGRLNFFGYWHAVFFFFVLWWFLAFLARLVLIGQSLLGHSSSQPLASLALRIWGETNVFLAVLAGFAVLLYVDNYGLTFSWQILRSSVTTFANLVLTTIGLLAVNLYFALYVYKPIRLKNPRKESSELTRLARRNWIALAFGCLLVGALLLLVRAVSASIAWPMTGVVAGVLFPILFAENYVADLFWNHNRAPDTVDCLGICVILVVSSGGFLTATAIALQGAQVDVIMQMAPAWGANIGVSLLTALLCIGVAWMASLTIAGGHLTDHTPMYNISQNFLEYWGLLQIVVIPVSIFVYRKTAPLASTLSADGKIALIVGFTACIIAIVGFPLKNNFEHLRDLEKRRSKYSSFHSISNHILFISIYVGAVTLLMLGWLWVSALDAMPKGK